MAIRRTHRSSTTLGLRGCRWHHMYGTNRHCTTVAHRIDTCTIEHRTDRSVPFEKKEWNESTIDRKQGWRD
jgi:hypothetical protein